MRIVGMDIHRVAAEAVALLDGKLEKLGRIPMLRESLEAFARKELTHDDHVIVEATGNTAQVRIFLLMLDNPEGLTARWIAEHLEMTPSAVRWCLSHLKRRGYVVHGASGSSDAGSSPMIWVVDKTHVGSGRPLGRVRFALAVQELSGQGAVARRGAPSVELIGNNDGEQHRHLADET